MERPMEMKSCLRLAAPLFTVLFLFFFIGGCRKDNESSTNCGNCPVETTPPLVASVSPPDGATNVPTNALVSAVFSEKIEPATLSTNTFIVSTIGPSGTLSVSGTVAYADATMTATFLPSTPLSPSTIYNATITGEVEDLAMNKMKTPKSWSFTTGLTADLTPPQFSGNDPQLVAEANSSNSVSLSWTAATDNTAPPGQIEYLVCRSTVSTDCLANPFPISGGNVVLYAIPAGATQLQVTGLTRSTTYYFVVRAKDLAGNVDANVAQKSAKTFGAFVQLNKSLISPVGDLNVVSTPDTETLADSPSISIVGGVPYVVWAKGQTSGNQRIIARRWDESAGWSSPLPQVNTSGTHAILPHTAASPGTSPELYVTFTECASPNSTCNVFVKKWNGTAWAPMGLRLNETADQGGGCCNSVIAFDGNGTLYAAWVEVSGGTRQIYVKKWNGTAWDPPLGGGSLTVKPARYGNTPSIAINGNDIRVAWTECNGSNDNNLCFLYVKQWDGNSNSWVPSTPAELQVGTFFNGVILSTPRLAFVGSVPYLAWNEAGNLYAKREVGGAWSLIGNGNSLGSVFNLDLKASTSTAIPYVAFVPSGPLSVKRWDGADWVMEGDGNPLNVSPNSVAKNPAIDFSGGTPYIAWKEELSGKSGIFVKRLE